MEQSFENCRIVNHPFDIPAVIIFARQYCVQNNPLVGLNDDSTVRPSFDDGDEVSKSGKDWQAERRQRQRVLPAEINGAASVSLKFPAYCRRSAAVNDPEPPSTPL